MTSCLPHLARSLRPGATPQAILFYPTSLQGDCHV